MRFSFILTAPALTFGALLPNVPTYPNEDIDIRLTEEQAKSFEEILERKVSDPLKARAIAAGPKVRLWDENYDPNADRFLLPYYFDEAATHTAKQRNLIKKSFDQYGEYTCVKMIEIPQNDTRFENKLRIIYGRGCYSYIGRHYEHQEISLGTDCEYSTYPIHEVMHALGFWHEHQRPDRDKHVFIHRDRTYLTDEQFVLAYSKDIWEMYDWKPSGSDYDINSITHYTSSMFSKDSDVPVMTYPGTNNALIIRNSKTFSANDIIDINFKYPCNQTGLLDPSKHPPLPDNLYSDNVKLKSMLLCILLPFILNLL